MDLLWPGFLGLLILIPLIIAIYIWLLRRRRRSALRYSSLSLVRQALPQWSRVKRHLPAALFLIGLASLILALSRPVTVVAVPTDQTTILLAIDVSRSMCSTDVQPSRIEAAENAALSFVQHKTPGEQIGIVAFSSIAEEIQSPTADEAALETAIKSLAVGRRTAIGSGLLKSIDSIAEVDKSVAPSVSTSDQEPTPVPKGDYAPDIIVLLTDGVSNTGPLPLDAAQQAVDRGVRVYTIGFGTLNGSEFAPCGLQFQGGEVLGGGGRGFGGGGPPPGNGQPGSGQPFGGGNQQFGNGNQQFGGRFTTRIDIPTLQKIADVTGGTYHSAESASELQSVFQNLPLNLIVKHETSEVSVVFTALGGILATIALVLSMLWSPLP